MTTPAQDNETLIPVDEEEAVEAILQEASSEEDREEILKALAEFNDFQTNPNNPLRLKMESVFSEYQLKSAGLTDDEDLKANPYLGLGFNIALKGFLQAYNLGSRTLSQKTGISRKKIRDAIENDVEFSPEEVEVITDVCNTIQTHIDAINEKKKSMGGVTGKRKISNNEKRRRRLYMEEAKMNLMDYRNAKRMCDIVSDK